MRVSIDRATLAHALSAVTKVIESRTTVPILSNVLLSVADGRLTVRGTDLDIEISTSVPVLDATDGTTTVDAKLLADIAKKAAGDIVLEQDGDVLVVKSGRSRFRLQTLPAEDYPSLASGTFDTEFDVDLAALVAPVGFAISTEETRYYLNGVFLHTVRGKLAAVATDGHRLARHYGDEHDHFDGVILPRKLVGILPNGTVHISLSTTKVRITTADSVITSKLIDGTFPDYQRVIPTGNDKIVTVDKAALQKAVDRVSVVSSERGRAVKLEIAPGSINLSVSSPDSGSAVEEIEADYSGEPVEIGFNARYLSEMLANFGGEKVRIALADSGSPTLISAVGDDALLSVLMPMRVS